MSDLAYGLNGEPFEVPGEAVGWRVRKLKAKGAPEVVYGREGIPLVLPIDADMSDLRREAHSEGRYRLDAVDEQSRAIPGCPPGYVCIHPGEPAPERFPVARALPALAPADLAVIEAMRVNAALAHAVIDKFPMMLESAAVLLRAADSAGMPRRPPPVLEEPRSEPADADDEGDEAPGPAEAATPSGLQSIVATVVNAAAPAILDAILSGKIRIPGGLGALLDCRRAAASDRAAAAPTTGAPGSAARPDQRNAAEGSPLPAGDVRVFPSSVALDGEAAAAGESSSDPMLDPVGAEHLERILQVLTPRGGMLARALIAELSASELRVWMTELQALSVADAVARVRAVLGPDAARESEPSARAHAGGMPGRGSSGAAASRGASASPGSNATASPRGAAPPGATAPPVATDLPTIDPAGLAHFASIESALTLREGMLARELVAELSPAELRAWIAELQTLSVPEAVARIRVVLGPEAGDPLGASGPPGTSGASAGNGTPATSGSLRARGGPEP